MSAAASRLAAALHEHVADVDPGDRLHLILDRAHRRPAACYIALVATITLLLAAALWQAAHGQPAHTTTVHVQEA